MTCREVANSFLDGISAAKLSSVFYPSTDVLPSAEFAHQYLQRTDADRVTVWDTYVVWNPSLSRVRYVGYPEDQALTSPVRAVARLPRHIRVSTLQNFLQVMRSGFRNWEQVLDTSGADYDKVMSSMLLRVASAISSGFMGGYNSCIFPFGIFNHILQHIRFDEVVAVPARIVVMERSYGSQICGCACHMQRIVVFI